MNVRKRLLSESEEKYKQFASSLLPGISNILGVRLPILRKIAKEISKSDWKSFLKSDCEYMEEVMLQAMVIGLKGNLDDVKEFVPKINNWSVCDSFCCSLKFINQNKEECWKFIKPYLNSNKEYEIRFGLVILLNYYIEDKYLKEIFNILDNFSSNEYYAQMAAAWLLSICFVKFQDETFEYLKMSKLDACTYNKSLQKIIESTKVDKQTKNIIRKMKR